MEKIAFIELTSYNAKLAIAEVNLNSSYAIVDRQCDDISLSLDGEKDHFLKKTQIDATIKILKNFRRICDEAEVTKTVCNCTFVQDSKPKNLISFCDEIYTSCGFKFNLMDCDAQTITLYNAVINTLDVPKGVAVMVDDECVRIIWYARRNILGQKVLSFGPMTLANMYTELSGEERLAKIKKYIAKEIEKIGFEIGEDQIILCGAGKYFIDLARMVRKYKKYPFENIHGYTMANEDIDYVAKQIRTLGLDKSKRIKGLSDARADLFLLSVEIIESVIKYFNSTGAVVSKNGMIEGMILMNTMQVLEEKPIADILGFSLTNISGAYDRKNMAHNEQVANLALLLFRQLRVIHKLPRLYIKVLRAAAYLHDVGKRVGFDNHARYGYYVVLNSDIFGLTHREIILAAFVVSLHNGGEFSITEWVKYTGLVTEEDLDAVKKLGTILHLAEELDRSKKSVIVDINCDILGDSVIMKTEANNDNSFEIAEALKVQKEFERNFKKKIEIL